MVRTKTKTEVATIKLTPECRRAWEAAATSERRSLANMFEVAILEYCQQHGIVAVSPDAAPPASVKKPTSKKAAAQ